MTTHDEHIELYARLGWPVFEVFRTTGRLCACPKGAACPSAGKHPAHKGWQELATSDLETLRRWLRFKPELNLGLATGRASGLIALDIDVKNNGDESLGRLIREYGELPYTVLSLTGGGGWHYLFRDPSGVARNSAGTIADGIDVRGEGGLIVLPPSRHSSGRPYTWDAGAHPEDTEPALAPTWLLELIERTGKRRGAPPIPAGQIPAGQRNNSLLRIAGAMRRVGASEQAILSALVVENAERCEPPLDAEEVIGIAASVMKYPPGESRPQEPDYIRRIDFLTRRAGGKV